MPAFLLHLRVKVGSKVSTPPSSCAEECHVCDPAGRLVAICDSGTSRAFPATLSKNIPPPRQIGVWRSQVGKVGLVCCFSYNPVAFQSRSSVRGNNQSLPRSLWWKNLYRTLELAIRDEDLEKGSRCKPSFCRCETKKIPVSTRGGTEFSNGTVSNRKSKSPSNLQHSRLKSKSWIKDHNDTPRHFNSVFGLILACIWQIHPQEKVHRTGSINGQLFPHPKEETR